jgi:hypothetical protein
MVEHLEIRRLLSAAITAEQSGNVLSVVGGSDAHTINIFERTDAPDGTVTVEDVSAGTSQTFTGISIVEVNGSAGADSIFMTGRTIDFDCNGNGGGDSLVISDTGTGSSRVSGDGDDDDITILAANATTVVGDGGGDKLYVQESVGTGETFLYGLGGSDVITTYAGINHIDGGGGKDLLIDLGGVNDFTSVETTV